MRVGMGKTHTRPCISIRSDTAHRLILKLHDESDKLVAHCLLPYKFVVRANGNDTGVGYSETQEHTPAQQQTLGPVFPVPNQPPAPTRSPVPPMNFHFAPASQHLQPNPNPSAAILQRLAPAEGPVSGGPTIWLSGINFPPPNQQMLYARFGAVVVPTVWLLFLLPQKTYPIHRSGSIHTRSSAGCLRLRLRGQWMLHSHYTISPEDRNSARVTARLDIIWNLITCQ